MQSFEYASPDSERDAVGLLNAFDGATAILSGGTDLLRLLKSDLISTKRVVDVRQIPTMQGIERTDDGIKIGALTSLSEFERNPLTAGYASLLQVIDATHSIQIKSSGTVVGDLCHMPNCWYFRNGYGLLALKDRESLVETGDNRYHAILGNQGPAKFVSASRLAPAITAWEGKVRIVGPEPDREEWLPLDYFYQTPKSNHQGVTVLRPGQLVTHIWLPDVGLSSSGSYEALQLNGLDWPLASASATLLVEGGTIRKAKVVLGHVAPTPWVSHDAANVLVGQSATPSIAETAAEVALSTARPLSMNGYKVQVARAAVKRAILRSLGMMEEGA